MDYSDTRPLLPFSPDAVQDIQIAIMLELFGPPPPGHHPTREMVDEVQHEVLKRFKMMPQMDCPN